MAIAISWATFARSALGITVGYILFVLGAAAAQELILGGVSYHDPLPKLALAGILTPLAGVIGGFVTAFIAGRKPYLHVAPMCALISVETAFLYARERLTGRCGSRLEQAPP